MWKVKAEVWGGVTGYRSGYLKTNGEILRFETFDEAEEAAAKARASMAKARCSTSYQPVPEVTQ